MKLTARGHDGNRTAVLWAIAAILAALAMLSFSPAFVADAAESTATTGVFVSLASPDSADGLASVGEEGSRDEREVASAQEGLPKAGDSTSPAVAALVATAAICLTTALIALRKRKRRRVDACARTRMLTATMAGIMVMSGAMPTSAEAQAASALTTSQDESPPLTRTLSSDVSPRSHAILSEGWDWYDCYIYAQGNLNALETVSVSMVPFLPPPEGFDLACTWLYADPTTREETIFASGTSAVIPREAAGKELLVRVSDRSGGAAGSFDVMLSSNVGLPLLKGSVRVSGTPDVGEALEAVVSLETPDAAPLKFQWFVGESEGSCSTLVEQGIQADRIVVDETMRGLYVTCVVSSDDASSHCGSLQDCIGPVPKASIVGTVSIEGSRTLGNTVSASIVECSVDKEFLVPVWYLGNSPGALEEQVGQGWELCLSNEAWEGRYVSCVVYADSIGHDGSFATFDARPVTYGVPGVPVVESVTVDAQAHATLNVACAQESWSARTERLRFEIRSVEGEWQTVGLFDVEDGIAEYEIPIPKIAEWGVAFVRAVAENSGGSTASDETRITAQFSVTVPAGIEGMVSGDGNASFSPQRIENTGSLNVMVSKISTTLSDESLGSSRWRCLDGDAVLFEGEFGIAQTCEEGRVLAPGESCDLLWNMTDFQGGEVSLSAEPLLYGTIGYTFRLP